MTTVRSEKDSIRYNPQPIKGCTVVGMMKKGRRKLPPTPTRIRNFMANGGQKGPWSAQGFLLKHDLTREVFSTDMYRRRIKLVMIMVVKKNNASMINTGVSIPYLQEPVYAWGKQQSPFVLIALQNQDITITFTRRHHLHSYTLRSGVARL